MKAYHIRGARGGWWRPKGEGYTNDIKQAGIFSEPYARGVVTSAPENTMVEVEQPEVGSSIAAVDLRLALSLLIEHEKKQWEHDSPNILDLEANLAYLKRTGRLEVKP